MDAGDSQHDGEPLLRRRVQLSPALREEVRQVIIEHESEEKKPVAFIWRFLEACVWVGIACLIITYTNFFGEVQTSPFIDRFYFNLGLFFLGGFALIGVYAIFWLSWIKGDENWENVPPSLFPTASFCIMAGLVFTTVGLWSLWSIFSPFIVFFVMMGFCMPITVV